MSKFARGLRVGVLVVGLPALVSACAGLSSDDRALLEQTQADAAAAQKASQDAADAARRAEQAAAEAADAASSATAMAEKSDRMMQQSLRK